MIISETFEELVPLYHVVSATAFPLLEQGHFERHRTKEHPMTSWHERLNAVLKEQERSVYDLAWSTNIDEATMQLWLDGAVDNPSYRDIIRACRALKISPEWLMDGVEPPEKVKASRPSLVRLPSLNQSVPEFAKEDSLLALEADENWLRVAAPGSAIEDLAVFSVRGDAMSPTLSHGDIVLVDRSDTTLQTDAIYVITYVRVPYLDTKRIQHLINGGITLLSDSPRYQNIDLEPGAVGRDITVLGRVMRSWHSDDYRAS